MLEEKSKQLLELITNRDLKNDKQDILNVNQEIIDTINKRDQKVELPLMEKNVLKRINKIESQKFEKTSEYTTYKASEYGRIANQSVSQLGDYLIQKYPELYKTLHFNLQLSGLKILSKTYVNIIIFTTMISALGFLLIFLGYSIVTNTNPLIATLKGVTFAFLVAVAVAILTYYYPTSVIGSKRKIIKADLPFMIMHMSAVAGSGAPPSAIFNLILRSKEYPGLESEIKKIVNYINLFGYNLTTALKTVSKTTPSLEFKELLIGMTTTIESGGDLKDYLKNKAEDTLNTYKNDRKKYVQSLATYSDIYTGVFIAAPLLFAVTLTIINTLGGKIGPLEVKTIALFGTFLVLPLLNIGFIFFLNITQLEK